MAKKSQAAAIAQTSSVADDARLDPEMRTEVDRLNGLPTAKLYEIFSSESAAIAGHLFRCAATAFVIERRGETIPQAFRGCKMFSWLSRIVSGGMPTARLVAEFVGRADLLERLLDLPRAEQARIADGGTVTLVVKSGDKFTNRKVQPGTLDARQMAQVFGPGGLRDAAAQQGWLRERQVPLPPSPGRRVPRHELRPCPDGRGVVVGKKVLDAADILHALGQCQPAAAGASAADDNEEVILRLTVSKRQRRALAARAGDAGISVTELTLQALRATGILGA